VIRHPEAALHRRQEGRDVDAHLMRRNEGRDLDFDVQFFLDSVHRCNHRFPVGPRFRRDGIDDPQEDILGCRRRHVENRGGRDVVPRHLHRGHVERRADGAALGLEELRLQPELQQALRIPRREPTQVHRGREDEFPLAQFVPAFSLEQEGDRIAELVHLEPIEGIDGTAQA